MKIKFTPKQPPEWLRAFAWLPVRISERHLAWLEFYWYRVVCTNEGGWAGGAAFRTDYKGSPTDADFWSSPERVQ